MKQKLFRWNRKLHRDLGYFTLGLTLIFAISGIALNHQDDWNPRYNIKVSQLTFKDEPREWTPEELSAFVVKLGIKDQYRSYYFSRPTEAKIFLKNGSLTLNLNNKQAQLEEVSYRPILNEWVQLHRNKSHLIWTIFSDIYAVILIFLAMGGLFMVKGKKGLKWRGLIIAFCGLVASLTFMFF